MSKPQTNKTCFVAMPISDVAPYEQGHFQRVYDHIIRPACEKAGLQVIRGDDVKATNYIMIDVLSRIVECDIVICDLSGRNPNVLYELGIRQAFDKPVVLMKDVITQRMFDIQGMRTLEYSEVLRVDTVARDVLALSDAIAATRNPSSSDVNSLIKLLGLNKAASLPAASPMSPDLAVVMKSMQGLDRRLARMEDQIQRRAASSALITDPRAYEALTAAVRREVQSPDLLSVKALPINEETMRLGQLVYDKRSGAPLGRVSYLDVGGTVAVDGVDGRNQVYAVGDEGYEYITTKPA